MGRETNKQRRERQAATAREKAAAARAQQKRVEQRRRAFAVLSAVLTIAVVGVLVAVIAIHSGGGNDAAGNRVAADPSVVKAVETVSPATYNSVGVGDAQLALTRLANQPPLTSKGKPDLLYIGGEFCPICAAERWSMAAALSRFGTLSDLSQMRSATDDGNLATLSFYKSAYRSKYLTFTPVENVDRNRKPLVNLTPAQAQTYKSAAGTTQIAYPFLDFGGKLMQRTEGYDGVSVLGTMTQKQIAAQLADPSSKVSKAILGEANNLTAAICMMTGNQPSSVCVSPTVTAITSQIPNA